MRRRLIFAITLASALVVLLGAAAGSQAAPGSLKILFTSNIGDIDPALISAIRAEPGVATVDTFDTSSGTPTAAQLATYDLVVSTGDSSYNDPVTWGNELADYLDAGGALIQFAYDNWQSTGAHPTGRFESGGYAPFVPGPNQNSSTTLGTIVAPGNPLLAGVTTLSTVDNTTDALASGATLLAKWADSRNAIATKGRVESVTASLDLSSYSPNSTIAQLVVNAGNVLGQHTLTVTTMGTGSGTVTGSGISCPPTCSHNYASGQAVTLAATSASGSTFAGWSGGGCSGTGSCTVTMTSNQTVTATFTSSTGCQDPAGAYNQGFSAGFNAGFNAGFKSGFNKGFHVGYGDGFASTTTHAAAARAHAIPAGCVQQFNQGFNQGFQTGFKSRFKSRFATGFTRGFKAGYSARHHG